MKKLWFLILLMLVGLVACTNESELPNEEDLLRLTLEELAFFDGLEGRKAYIAVNGNIYDVTNSSLWPNGSHNGYQAGQDLTHPIMNLSPHGLSTLNGVPLIGILVEAVDEAPEIIEEETNEDIQPLQLTLEQLSFYDGREGRPAYIAVNGNIYDVSNSPRWPNGSHNGYQAGQDLTHPIMNLSPHGLSTLQGIPIVGILVVVQTETPEIINEEASEEVGEEVGEEAGEEVGEEADDETQLLQLTLEQLSYYDGREGRPAYIAVNGNIYDVSNSPRWPNGSHNGYQAGQDLTNPIMNSSPHGISTLSGIPIIGVLVESSDDPVSSNTQLLHLTLDELSYFDGREGRAAYVAVNGDIYDVTNSPLWPNGSHNDHHAGQDLTAELTMLSSHGLETLENMPIIGTLVESSQSEAK